MRVFALSDIHVDYAENLQWIRNISTSDYRQDTILLAGDATHDMDRLRTSFELLRQRFRHVFFVPGNHELWVMKGEKGNSVDKFHTVLSVCREMGVQTDVGSVGEGPAKVWIVPLFSWYVTPEEGRDSLFLPKRGGDQGMKVWSDSYFVKWPEFDGGISANTFFLNMNQPRIQASYDAPVISFSHFLSRRDLLFTYGTDMEAVFRRVAETPPNPHEKGEGFNFSRVAGSRTLDIQIRTLGSQVHVHGHQHRNRYRMVDGILYTSHCLGYKHERAKGILPQIDAGPLKIWDQGPHWNPAQIDPY